ncbi:hypothetical protein Q7C36_021447 [Tachysurus vachellii]|uniref:Uncharacterized protein n=1 Tax=Tachysurus vachellii TaxID=175792 RepID=A0AA88J183_TACVA|nr:hypothetical protein Q7C36_021447 [Tachysurus vachellii]
MGVHHDHLVGVLEGRRTEDKEASIFMDYKKRSQVNHVGRASTFRQDELHAAHDFLSHIKSVLHDCLTRNGDERQAVRKSNALFTLLLMTGWMWS